MTPRSPISVEGIQISESGIAHFESNQVINPFVPKPEIRAASVKHGFQSRNPLITLGLGVILLSASSYWAYNLVTAWVTGAKAFSFYLPIGSIFLVLLAIWLIRDSTKRGHYLEVRTDRETHKFSFHNSVSAQEMQIFIDKACHDFGYSIDFRPD